MAKVQRQPIKKQQAPSYIEEAVANAKEEAKKPVPSRRRRVVREQVSTRILLEIRDAADDYMSDSGMTFQGLVEAALTEYLESAGYAVGASRR